MITRIISISDYQTIGGKLHCIGTRQKIKHLQPKPKEARTLETYWMEGAPIAYADLEAEMMRTGVISDIDHTWQLIHKGGSPVKYMRALYNVCYRAKCLPFMTGPELMEAFNASYNCKLTYYRPFNGKGRCDAQEDGIINRLSVLRTFFSDKNDATSADE